MNIKNPLNYTALKRGVLLSFILVANMNVVFGQEPLSLSDAIAISLDENYGIQIQEKQNIIAKNNNAWGETGLLPTITLQLQSQNSRRNQSSDNLFFGGQLFPGFELNDQRTYNLVPSAQVNWTIFQGGKAILTKRRLEQMEAESMQNAEVVVSNTIQSVILAYYIAVLEKQRLKVYEKQMNLSADRFEYLRTKFEIGGAASTDVMLEEGNYLTDSVNIINQGLIYHNAIRNLNVLMVNDNLNQDYELTDSLVFEDQNYNYDQLEGRMLSENVDLKKIYVSQSILELEVKRNQADLYPKLNFNGGYEWNRNKSDLTSAEYSGPNTSYQNPPDPLISKTGTYFANFTLSFNLYNGGRVNRAIRNSVVSEDIGNLQIDQLKQSLTQDLMEAFERYEIRKKIYMINARKEKVAETNLNVSNEKFKNGSINSFDFRVVQNNYLAASSQKLEALYLLKESRVELMRLTGGIVSSHDQ
ncbi:TolC family protein [Marinoscillum sp. MHG1-6]|uniref:TolC family protein n=1 Tax=Marinoscillum sp. MHG1-6 TaxID=2959627 RepID=UPI002156FE99|nr:TolC family protein [Marinoscillum sp. MHG1-6]